MNLRALQARMRKLEKQTGLKNGDEVLIKMTDEELEATVAVFDLGLEKVEYREEALQIIRDRLDCNQNAAETFLNLIENLEIDSAQFKHLSDEELIAEIARLDVRIDEYRESKAAQ